MINTPGEADGYTRLWVDGVEVSEMTGLIFRDDSAERRVWQIAGILFNDMWGGTPAENPSPHPQTYWFSRLTLYRLQVFSWPRTIRALPR